MDYCARWFADEEKNRYYLDEDGKVKKGLVQPSDGK